MFDRRQPAAASFAYRNRPDTNARPPTPVFLNTSYRAALESPTFAIGPVAQIWMGWILALIRARSVYLSMWSRDADEMRRPRFLGRRS